MIAQGTGQYGGASEYTPFSPPLPQYGFAQPYPPVQQQFMPPQQAVQPHINPRFIGQFGWNPETMQQQPGQQYLAYSQYGVPTTPGYEGSWVGQWGEQWDQDGGGEHPDVTGHDHNG